MARIFKLIVNALLLFVVLPVAIVGILGLLLSPFQTAARATEPKELLEVNDLMLSEVVKEQVRQAESTGEDADPNASFDIQGEMLEQQDMLENLETLDGGNPEVPIWSPETDGSSSSEASSGNLEANGSSNPEVSVGDPEMNGWDESTASTGDSGMDGWSGSDASAGNSEAKDQSDLEASAWVAEEDGASSLEHSASYTPEESGYYSSDQLRVQGLISDGGVNYTWYSQRVLPGGGLNIDGRHVSSEGYVVDGQERIVVASSDLPYGTELAVPFGNGTAVVLDTGCAPGTVDVYTDF